MSLIGQLARRQQLVQRRAAHELGDEVGALVVDRGLVQRHDRRVRKPGGRTGLAFEAAADDPLARHDLDRNVALEALIPRQPDGAVGPRAEPMVKPVPAENERAGGGGPVGAAGLRPPTAGPSVPGLDSWRGFPRLGGRSLRAVATNACSSGHRFRRTRVPRRRVLGISSSVPTFILRSSQVL